MATVKGLAVNRQRLIDALEGKRGDLEKSQAKAFKAALADEIKDATGNVAGAEKALEALKKTTSPDDAPGSNYRLRRFKSERNDLDRDIELLKLSDEETIIVGPMSNFYKYL